MVKSAEHMRFRHSHCPPPPTRDTLARAFFAFVRCIHPRRLIFFQCFKQNLEEINVLRITLDTQIEDLEQHFETAHINYLQVGDTFPVGQTLMDQRERMRR